ncbi:MAG: lytic transglycosylase domain-containing protein [Pseudomonadota bacterium]
MKKLTFICFLLIAMHHFSAVADVYIDMEQTNEISISNTQVNPEFTLKIEEPVVTLATENHKSNSIKRHNSAHTALLPYHNEVLQAAHVTSLEPALIHAVITVESKHNAQATSQKGAYGLMQLMPATARRFHVKDKTSTAQNILAGSQYLRELLTLFNGDLSLSLAAYNAGPGAVQKYSNRVPPYRETMRYVPKVLQYYRQYS